MDSIDLIKNELRKYSKEEKSQVLSRFFKTGKGEYGEGDVFIGVIVPDQRKVAKAFFKTTSLLEVEVLLRSKIHEERLTSLFILILKYENEKEIKLKKEIVDLYLKNLDFVNSWDLVDLSAEKLLGDYIFNYSKEYTLLTELAKREHLWSQRVAIVSTFYFIRKGEYKYTFEVAKILLNHKHDLIHKAVGWMLREVGKRSFEDELVFLKQHYKAMPRTMLRYAVEKFDNKLRKDFLAGTI